MADRDDAPQTPPRAGSAAERTPDAFGDAGRASVVEGMLRNIQQQRFQLEVETTVNGLSDDAQAPSAPQRTVADHREFLRSSEERLLSKFSDLVPEVAKSIERQRKAEEQARATAESTA